MSSVLGIDLGTQQLKLVVYDADARQLQAVVAVPLDLNQKEDGTAEQPAEWWVAALLNALSQLDATQKKSIAAIGVSGQQHGFVPVSQSGEVLAPVKLWCDTSTQDECDQITNAVGGQQRCIELAGNPILPGYTASKILWLKQSHPALYDQMSCVLLPHDYLNFYLTGERCMEAGDASGTGLLDIRERSWSPDMLQAIDPQLGECLPPVRVENCVIGELRADVAAATGLPTGVPVSIGGGDNMMGAIGTGNVEEGKLTMSLGTSGTVYAHSNQPIVDPNGEIAAFCSSSGGWLPLLCTMNCTVSTEFARGLFGVSIDEFEAQVSRAAPGSGGILTLPFFNGERTPNLPLGKGCLVGIDTQNGTPENIMRSAMEGATFALRYGIDRLRSLGVAANKIVLTGGGANSPSWRQMVADISGRRVAVLQQQEGAAFGAALQALGVLAERCVEEFVDEHISEDAAQCCEPDANATDIYSDRYKDYRLAVDTITSLYS